MKYKVTHKTTYTYGETVPVCHNQVYLAPREFKHQSCRTHRLSIKPTPTVSESRDDYFGNETCFFSVEESHRRLSVTAISRVDVRTPPPPDPSKTPAWEAIVQDILGPATSARIGIRQFAFPSPSIHWFPELETYTRESFSPGRPILEATIELMSRIYTEFKYDPTVTTVQTPVDEVFRLRHGVCQDFAHLMIASLRSIGLAARYVSGYLRTIPPPGEKKLVGADATHAWLAVYCGGRLWIGVDPTNNCIVGDDHITLAWGRDYTDVCPIKGVYVGSSIQNLTVAVDVVPLAATS
ncbi:MAG: transglutaminase family protein [Planctomycetota bacterium]|nr:transglutaminase family protein [Planctomycetota bacterium]MDA1213533.1 transglutaminase family protein [Planctomycetota bacterium]